MARPDDLAAARLVQISAAEDPEAHGLDYPHGHSDRVYAHIRPHEALLLRALQLREAELQATIGHARAELRQLEATITTTTTAVLERAAQRLAADDERA